MKIGIVAKREYLTRVKKKSFVIMTIVGPLLLAAFYGVLGYLSVNKNVGAKPITIVLISDSAINIGEKDALVSLIQKREFSEKELLNDQTIDGFVILEKLFDSTSTVNSRVIVKDGLSVSQKTYLSKELEKFYKQSRLKSLGIAESFIQKTNIEVDLSEYKISETGEIKSSSVELKTAVGLFLSFLVYFFIFLYGVQVLKAVVEEKSNRIIELIVSTVKPFELMAGKIIGIAGVGLTQLTIWVVLSAILTTAVSVFFGVELTASSSLPTSEMPENTKIFEMLTAALELPWLLIVLSFVFFFVGGYFLYGALFAAIGAAVDSETDTQQFMLPITLPIIFSLMISFSVVTNDPHGSLATWLSFIPFTSPIVMLVRIPFSPPFWQIILSMFFLILGVIGTTWVAARIYRTGILIYGQKPSWKELFKWFLNPNK